jgi:hypothetical protein
VAPPELPTAGDSARRGAHASGRLAAADSQARASHWLSPTNQEPDMSTDKTVKKLEINKETLRSLVDLAEVRGGAGEEDGRGVVVQISKNNNGRGSWFLCCR